jgi:DNA-directed RNA polymerase subunit RPC12/RpoP
METETVTIYHCITCGRMVRDEIGTSPPECCGHPMTKAVTETVREGEAGNGVSLDATEPTVLPIAGTRKPR